MASWVAPGHLQVPTKPSDVQTQPAGSVHVQLRELRARNRGSYHQTVSAVH